MPEPRVTLATALLGHIFSMSAGRRRGIADQRARKAGDGHLTLAVIGGIEAGNRQDHVG